MKTKLSLLIAMIVCSGCNTVYKTTDGFSEGSFVETINTPVVNTTQTDTQPVIVESVPVVDNNSKAKDPVYLKKQEDEFRKDLAESTAAIVKNSNDLYIYIPTVDVFGYGGNSIQPTIYAYNTLNKIAINLLDQEFSTFTVSVYQSAGEYKDPNFNVVEARARVLTNYLLSKGVPSEKIIHSVNSVLPIVGMDTNAGLVEVKIKNGD